VQIEERDGAIERRVLTACIVSKDFLAKIAGKTGDEPFRSKHANLIYQWCHKHYLDHKEAPGKLIQAHYETWAAAKTQEDARKSVDRLLTSLSGQYEQEDDWSLPHAIQLAEDHWNIVLLEKLRETLEAKLARGRTIEGVEAATSFHKIDLSSPPFVDVLRDEEAQKRALENRVNPLISFQGPAAEFFGNELAEDSFICFMAPIKSLKSYLCLDLAWRALLQGKKVAYFQIGDLSQDQLMRRFWKRAANRPLDARTIMYPTSIMVMDDYREPAIVVKEAKTFREPLVWERARSAFSEVMKKTKGELRLFRYSTKTVSVNDLKAVLDSHDNNGWRGQVVVVDYSENLKPVNARAERDVQTDTTFAILKQISESGGRLVITPHQANKQGFRAYTLSRDNFRNSLMVLAHCTSFLGINMTDEERDLGIMRLNFVVRREEKYTESMCLHCATCIDLSRPIVCAGLPRRSEKKSYLTAKRQPIQ
jgi:hypothetical protein